MATTKSAVRSDVCCGGVDHLFSAYRELLDRLQHRIRESQARAARVLNTELVMLYWSIGRDIVALQQERNWGDDVIGLIAEDLRVGTGSKRGFSRRNLFYMRRFASLWPDWEKVPSVMAQIGWTAHRILLDKFSHRTDLYEWYCVKTVSNRWSVRYLEDQVSLELHKRHSAAINNFSAVLEPADAEQALQATKDPYIFDYLDLAEDFTERQLEKALLNDIQKLLLELGVGFMFYGRQRPLFVGDQEFYPDLLFYHHTLRRFVVIELKVREFAVESVSKMNLYLNAIDEQLCTGDDKESVGIILCKSHNETVAKLALHRMSAPIAVSTWRQGADLPLSSLEITDEAPDDLKELDRVRTRLVNHVVRRTREILSAQGKSKP